MQLSPDGALSGVKPEMGKVYDTKAVFGQK
jgi:hypothetical protein